MSDPEKVPWEDVDEVIEAAAKAKNQDADSLSVEELEEMAAELDIPRERVAPAVEEVRRRREQKLASERAQAARRHRVWRAIQIGAGALALVLLGWGWSTHAVLRDAKLAADRQRAQVVNVMQRQRATGTQWQAAADSPEKQAELSGAENRVRIERARYDEAVTEYRRHAAGLMARVVIPLTGYPQTLPLSSELESW